MQALHVLRRQPQRSQGGGQGIVLPGVSGGTECLQRGGGLSAWHIVRVAAGQGELRQLHGVGTVGGRLAGGDELVCGGDLIPQNGGHL